MSYNGNDYQELLLDEDGFIMESDDGLFNTGHLIDDCLFDYFPLLESVFPSLVDRRVSEVRLNRVATTFDDLPGYYDFLFFREEDGIRWEIYDLTDDYNDYEQDQQERNEQALEQEEEEDAWEADW